MKECVEKKPIKVLVVGLSDLIGGVETFIYNIMINSNKEDVIYDFLIIGDKKPVFEKEIFNFYNGENHIFYVPNYKDGIFKAIKELNKFYLTKGKEYKYIHLNTCTATKVIYCFPYYLRNKTKIITHSHNGNGRMSFNNKIFRPIVNLISFKRFSCSDLASKWLFGNKSVSKVKLINNGIDTKKFEFNLEKRINIRQRYNINDKCFLIGNVGRFMEQKNHSFLIDIFSEIKKSNPNSKLLLIGDGILKSDIKRKIESYGLRDSVIFAGIQYDVSEFYSSMDLFILPSLYEGLPIVAVEAQCSGLKCVFSDTISKQVDLLGYSNFYPLQEPAKYWADKILKENYIVEDRIGCSKVVKDKGYDIKDTARYLEDIYKE